MRGNRNKIFKIFILICLVLSLVYVFKSVTFLFNLSPKIIAENFSDNSLIKSKRTIPGQLDMLTYSTFDPFCCPSVYTTSSGCLCFDNKEDLAIITRGGNREYTYNDRWINIASRSVDKREGKRPDSHAHNILNV
jgi:hypothetical protein